VTHKTFLTDSAEIELVLELERHNGVADVMGADADDDTAALGTQWIVRYSKPADGYIH
jgi:hypothetical protein